MSEPEFFGPGLVEPTSARRPDPDVATTAVRPPGPAPTDTAPTDTAPVDAAVLRGRGVATIASIVLLLVAAAGSVLASFGTVYGVDFHSSSLPNTHVDGWGRYPSLSSELGSEHGTRYGIALVVVAAVLVLIAVLLAAGRLAPTSRIAALDRGVRVVGIAAIGALIGVLASAALEAGSLINTFHIEIHLQQLDTSDQSDTTAQAHPYYGSLFWLGAIAAACAILAFALPPLAALGTRIARRRRSPDADADADAHDDGPQPSHAEDETLGAGRTPRSGRLSE